MAWKFNPFTASLTPSGGSASSNPVEGQGLTIHSTQPSTDSITGTAKAILGVYQAEQDSQFVSLTGDILTSNTSSSNFTLTPSQENSGHEAWRAFDGNLGTSFEMNAAPERSLTILFSSPTQVVPDTIRFRKPAGTGVTKVPVSMEIYVDNVLTASPFLGTEDYWGDVERIVNFYPATSGTEFKFVFIGTNGDGSIAFTEFALGYMEEAYSDTQYELLAKSDYNLFITQNGDAFEFQVTGVEGNFAAPVFVQYLE